MALSENEQRILAQLEDQLRAQDPGLERRASRLGRAGGPRDIVKWGVLLAVGFGLLLMLTFHPLFAVAGVALMLFSMVQGAQVVSSYARDQVTQARQKASRSDEA